MENFEEETNGTGPDKTRTGKKPKNQIDHRLCFRTKIVEDELSKVHKQ